MGAGDKYFYGQERARITPDRIRARPMQNNKIQVANVMNEAFRFYYDAHQGIEKMFQKTNPKNPTSRQALNDLKWAVTKDLHRTANRNTVMADLLTCFRHLDSTGGYWDDDTWNGWKGVCNIPQGVSDFLDAVEEQGTVVAGSYKDWQRYTTNLAYLKSSKKWDECGTQIGYAKTALETAGPKLWTVLGGSREVGEARIGLAGKWLDYAATVHGAADTYLKLYYNKDGAKEAAFAESMAWVVGGLPVFGQLYGDVIRSIPGVVTYFKQVAAERNRMLEQAMR
jgi:hypothetical protein